VQVFAVRICCETFLLCLAAAVLIFLIAGLLNLLRFKRVDKLGAYSIPSEIGLLIPSDCNSHPHNRVRQVAKESSEVSVLVLWEQSLTLAFQLWLINSPPFCPVSEM
jgi:hypothetical protein